MSCAKRRESFAPSGEKDDPTDAQWALELLPNDPDRCPQLVEKSPVMRSMASLTEHRRCLVNDRVKASNRSCLHAQSVVRRCMFLPRRQLTSSEYQYARARTDYLYRSGYRSHDRHT
ncbi:IS110 family transposase [Pseudomonas frederiksbergensis]|uniref:IS110 family transposase n=1 Tax=Pseudomonas frederiksbergensis TaxID=104087 RepID=UPI00197E6B22|nr:IS110 family transposase [Pseudomonas frederiksbergensis]